MTLQLNFQPHSGELFQICLFFFCLGDLEIPSEEFEVTANSLGAHIETHGELILRTLMYLTVNSQDELIL